MIGRDELLRQIKAEREFTWCRNEMDLHKVVLYSDEFQKRLVRLPKEKQILYDEQIKDYVLHIRNKRDELWRQQIIPR